jgi:site-specific recombinase XerD
LPLWALFSGKPEIIAQKYLNKGKKRLFYGMTNPKVNLLLKELAKRANINKSLHFHASRHSFGSTMVNEYPITTVQSLMQHSDIRTTNGYLHLSDEKRTKNLEQNPID